MNASVYIEKKYTFSALSFCYFLMGVQIVLDNVARNSIIFQVSALLFMVVTVIYLVLRKSIRINSYHIILLVFIIYSLLHVITGESFYKDQSLSMLQTIVLNLSLSIIIYSLMVYSKNINKVLNAFIWSTTISNILILLIYKDSLFTGRLAFSWRDSSTYNLFGIEFTTVGSNTIAYYSSLAVIFTIYLIYKIGKRNIFFFHIVLSIFTVFSTGSRKGLLFLILGILISLFFLNKGSKKVIYSFFGVILGGGIYSLTQLIPKLYEIVGERLNQLINLVFGEEINDTSISTRMRLINYAKELVENKPLYGYGLDNFRLISPYDGIVSDNNYLEILVSGGIVGFVIYYSYVIIVGIKFLKLKKKNVFTIIMVTLLIVTLVMEYGQVTYYWRAYSFFYSLLFFALYVNRSDDNSQKSKNC